MTLSIKMNNENIYENVFIKNKCHVSNYRLPMVDGNIGDVVTTNGGGMLTFTPPSSLNTLKTLSFSLNGYTASGNIILATNTSNKVFSIIFTTLLQKSYVGNEMQLTLFTPTNSAGVGRLSKNSSGTNTAVPRVQTVQINGTGGQWVTNSLLWYPSNNLTINFLSDPTGLTGSLTIYYFEMVL
jgi:hypothetical protein